MKAIVARTYGSPDVLELQDIDKPQVDDDSVLVRVRAASVNAYDVHVMRGQPYVLRMNEGLRRPKQTVRGVDLAGEVEAVGKNVTKFQPGDEVYGERGGAFAEYVCAAERKFALKPTGLTFEQAAAVPMAGFTALQALRDKGQLKTGQRVLIHGAGGGVGTFAVQVAKAFGAEVTGVCGTANIDMVRSIGADHVIDYTREDFARSGERYDLILAVAANRSLSAFRRVMVPNGTFVLVGAPNGQWIGPLAYPLKAIVLSRFVSQHMLPFLATYSQDDLVELTRLIDAGKLTPVIDRCYSLKEVPEALRYVEVGHAKGKVVITI
jgi:NADPH:quinone reductase-like Zn-dependent oxidoreductase